jgi:uncharacterized protein YndB with AHSA1/START domain
MTITVTAIVQAPLAKTWEYWTRPEHIVRWNQASDDWHSPFAENNLVKGGQFITRMEARDGSMGFDFKGTYDEVIYHRLIAYTMEDGRKVEVSFVGDGDSTVVEEIFDPELENSRELQQQGWQAILNSFKHYAETY